MRKTISSFLFGTILMLPLAVQLGAQDRDDHRDDHSQRYYDSNHKDYHQWNDSMQDQFNRYLDEHHRNHHDFARASKREQQDFWNWQHSHEGHDDHR